MRAPISQITAAPDRIGSDRIITQTDDETATMRQLEIGMHRQRRILMPDKLPLLLSYLSQLINTRARIDLHRHKSTVRNYTYLYVNNYVGGCIGSTALIR